MGGVRVVVVGLHRVQLPEPREFHSVDEVLSVLRDLAPEVAREVEGRPMEMRVVGEELYLVPKDVQFG